jgi:hypothetical protein
MTARTHYAAVRERLNGGPILTGKVSDAARVNTETQVPLREQYVILSGGPADELDDDRLASVQDVDSDAEYLYETRSVGITPDGAMLVADEVSARLIGFAPVIEGRSCGAMERDYVSRVTPDFGVKPAIYYVDQDFTLTSNRA